MTRNIKHAKTALTTPSVAYTDWNAELVDDSGTVIDLDAYANLAEDELVTGDWKFGSVSDHVDITDGVITFANAAKRLLTMRPTLYAGSVAGSGKPTSVQIGIHAGYSMPISAGADGEVLYFRDWVPGRWDGATDPIVSVVCCLDTANTAGEDFALTLQWDNDVTTTGAVSATNAVTVITQTELTAGHTAQYSIFKVLFTIDAIVGPQMAMAARDEGRKRSQDALEQYRALRSIASALTPGPKMSLADKKMLEERKILQRVEARERRKQEDEQYKKQMAMNAKMAKVRAAKRKKR